MQTVQAVRRCVGAHDSNNMRSSGKRAVTCRRGRHKALRDRIRTSTSTSTRTSTNTCNPRYSSRELRRVALPLPVTLTSTRAGVPTAVTLVNTRQLEGSRSSLRTSVPTRAQPKVWRRRRSSHRRQVWKWHGWKAASSASTQSTLPHCSARPPVPAQRLLNKARCTSASTLSRVTATRTRSSNSNNSLCHMWHQGAYP